MYNFVGIYTIVFEGQLNIQKEDVFKKYLELFENGMDYLRKFVYRQGDFWVIKGEFKVYE